MLESSPDVPELEALRLYVYRRPLHPELFGIFLDDKVKMGGYEADLWVLGLGHLVCFHTGDRTVTELVTSESGLLPDSGRVETLVLTSPKEYWFCLDKRIHYVVSTQYEQMSKPVFERVYDEMVGFGEKRGLFIRFDQWADEGQWSPFTLMDYDRRPRELCLFAYHVFPGSQSMVRTQSMFSLDPPPRSQTAAAGRSGGRSS